MANVNSDLILLENQVKVEAWDLCLDSKDPKRRKNGTPHRRALVHDFDDHLTINYANDYPNGVKIQSDTVIEGSLHIVNGVLRAKVNALEGWEYIGSPPTIFFLAEDLRILNQDLKEESKNKLALSHVAPDKLIINRNKGYEGGVEIEGRVNIKEYMTIGSASIGSQFSNKDPYVYLSADSIRVNNVKVEGHNITIKEDIDLVQEILKLRKEISDLKNRIKALEA